MPNQNVPTQQIAVLEQKHNLLSKIQEDVRQILNTKAELERQVLLQRLDVKLETELQALRIKLGQQKKNLGSGELYHVPKLPEGYEVLSNAFNEMKSKLVGKKNNDGLKPLLILSAQSGMGKSALVSALAQDADVRRSFPDGVYWVTIGQDADVLTHQLEFIHTLGANVPEFIDAEVGTEHLRRLCETQVSLVIFDDVVDAQELLSFNVSSETCQVIVTTSDQELVDIIKYFIPTSQSVTIKPLTAEQATAFFVKSLNNKEITPNSIPPIVDVIIQACDYHPLSIKYMANLVRNKPVKQWEEWADRLQNPDFEFPEKYPQHLMQSLHLNIEDLGEQGEYYLALAVFADYTHIPQSLVLMLWRYLYQVIDEQGYNFIRELNEKALVQVDGVSRNDYIYLHTFQRDYVINEADVDKLHNHLLAIYRRHCGQHGWISGPNDGYFFQNLGLHLFNAGRKNELRSLLIDFDWIYNKLKVTSLHDLINDYEWFEEDQVVEAIKQALYDAATVLLDDKKLLPVQLLEFLWPKKSLSQDIQALLNQAQELTPDWTWQPIFPE